MHSTLLMDGCQSDLHLWLRKLGLGEVIFRVTMPIYISATEGPWKGSELNSQRVRKTFLIVCTRMWRVMMTIQVCFSLLREVKLNIKRISMRYRDKSQRLSEARKLYRTIPGYGLAHRSARNSDISNDEAYTGKLSLAQSVV